MPAANTAAPSGFWGSCCISKTVFRFFLCFTVPCIFIARFMYTLGEQHGQLLAESSVSEGLSLGHTSLRHRGSGTSESVSLSTGDASANGDSSLEGRANNTAKPGKTPCRILNELPHSNAGSKFLKQQCSGPFGASKPENTRRLAVLVRGESFRGLQGMYDRHVDVNNWTFGCQEKASRTHVKLVMEPFEACGYKIDAFLATWKARDEFWGKGGTSGQELIGMYGGRVVKARFDNHAEYEKIGLVKNDDKGRTPQCRNFITGLSMVANYSRDTGTTWDALLVIRYDLIFKKGLSTGLRYDRVMLPFREWTQLAGDYSADTIQWFPWRFLNCAVQEEFREHSSLTIGYRVGFQNFAFMERGTHDANSAADRNPIYKMCRAEQQFEINGGFALIIFSACAASKKSIEANGLAVRRHLWQQAEPRKMPPADVIVHLYSRAADKEIIRKIVPVNWGQAPASKGIDVLEKGSSDLPDAWSRATNSLRKSVQLATTSVVFKYRHKLMRERAQKERDFTFDRLLFARSDYKVESFVSAYHCKTDVEICVGYGAVESPTIPVVIISSQPAAVKFASTSEKLEKLEEFKGMSENATKFLEEGFGLPVRVVCKEC